MKTTSSVENINPRKAGMWLDEAYKNHRPVSKARVNFYAEEMERGMFGPTNTIAFAVLNGNQLLVNGRHTLKAINQSGVTLKQNPVTKHYVDNEDQVNDLYAHYDINKSRNYMDSLRAYAIDEMTELPLSDLEKLTSALVYAKQGFPSRPHRPLIPHDALIDMLLEWVDEWKILREIIAPCDTYIRNRVLSKPTASISLITIRHQLGDAEEFWREVAQINRLNRGDPRMALHKALVSWDYHGQHHPKGATPGAFARAAAYAWNKWRAGKSLTVVKLNVVENERPVKIDGTPYKG